MTRIAKDVNKQIKLILLMRNKEIFALRKITFKCTALFKMKRKLCLSKNPYPYQIYYHLHILH